MGIKKQVTNYRMAQWAEILQERAASGLTIREYCEKTMISVNAFYYWQRKLREALLAASEEERTTSLVPQSFTEVHISGYHENPSYEERLPPGQGLIYIEIQGMHIRADSGYPVVKLARLLKGLVAS